MHPLDFIYKYRSKKIAIELHKIFIQLHVSTLWAHPQADFQNILKEVYIQHFHNAIYILLLICSKSQPDDEPIVSKHVKVK